MEKKELEKYVYYCLDLQDYNFALIKNSIGYGKYFTMSLNIWTVE